ncbi:helix-turn-helix domain-containing protein [Furfurilactobacillus entadae]|uniref:helix-turn-helix domain-containing protein n=1 Tax=Furfurilactobacillus entadae TaxID=2922307 RepID=UPI0035EB193B
MKINLNRILKERDISINKLSQPAMTGIARNTLTALAAADELPEGTQIKTLQKICTALNIELYELIAPNPISASISDLFENSHYTSMIKGQKVYRRFTFFAEINSEFSKASIPFELDAWHSDNLTDRDITNLKDMIANATRSIQLDMDLKTDDGKDELSSRLFKALRLNAIKQISVQDLLVKDVKNLSEENAALSEYWSTHHSLEKPEIRTFCDLNLPNYINLEPLTTQLCIKLMSFMGLSQAVDVDWVFNSGFHERPFTQSVSFDSLSKTSSTMYQFGPFDVY